jgi:translocation and assembly module TamB
LLDADINLNGTVGAPEGVARVKLEKPTAYQEDFERFAAEIRLSGTGVEVINGQLDVGGGARVLLSGAFDHKLGDWKNGRIRADVASQNLTLAQIDVVRKQRPDLKGSLAIKAQANGIVQNAALLPEEVNGTVNLTNLGMDGRDLGDINVVAHTEGRDLDLAATGNLQGAKFSGRGAVQLQGDYFGKGQLDMAPTSIAALRGLAQPGSLMTEVDGLVQATATFSGPLRRPEQITGRLTIPTLTLVPTRKTRSPQENLALAVRNEGPIVIEYANQSAQIKSVQLVGPNTDVKVDGSIALKQDGQWNLRVLGSVNLGVAEHFDRELVASGSANIAASIRGTLRQPQLAGTMRLQNASFYVTDVPNGIDEANGVIRFDQNRATIVDTITAKTGGGQLSLSGYVGLAGGQAQYRLAAHLEGVRVRYPEGVSTTASADLNFTGTTAQSTLSGTVSVQRVSFNPRADVGGLLASSANPVSTPPTPNPFLRGMQLNVRIETVPNIQLQTSYTTELEAQADLRLRGTAARPVLSGRVNVDRGEIRFFGTRYTINRGDVNFFNPVKIEPVVDLDLETTVRAIVVNISISGTPQKLNVSYRSDPPLQPNEIIALLAVGRTPGTSSTLASSQTVQPNFLASGTNSLLGQALSAPVSGRLQRFFGVSRLKIDPMLTGINAVPQARLTVEQQISKAITLTYITNLAQVNQQIVRVEWDLNRDWSLIAVREENGAFGVDFLYKKRFR